jgi:hypothetical protein
MVFSKYSLHRTEDTIGIVPNVVENARQYDIHLDLATFNNWLDSHAIMQTAKQCNTMHVPMRSKTHHELLI